MKKPYFITFTGVDDLTDLNRLVALSRKYPIEWGVLVGGRLGKSRYPSVDRVNAMSDLSRREPDVYCAMHLCGQHAKNAQNSLMLPVEYDTGGYSRFQVNSLKYDLKQIGELAQKHQKEIIIQHRNGPHPDDLPVGVFALHDESGGKGKVPGMRPAPKDKFIRAGYAGGIGPDNVREVVAEVGRDSLEYWLDCESKIRSEIDGLDRLDLDKCEFMCKEIWS